ncbi:D-glycerate dehydrogenase [Aromatoleum toluvorans]|uniref:D-glycerate dehydrogenase n=1 Tax=Aromatoleum toluvorans TaxID=92002 RepID=A0ABX1PVF5_9RHOO|nr:D-glycerate dehydrogenase [Aromatoleum toluvorans]NMG43413.1 D-glycerate dehydrogenase [Aromatoleum toluvorans]
MTRPRLILTRRWPAEVERALSERFDVRLNTEDRPFTRDEIRAALAACDALLATVSDRIDADALGTAPNAKLIANYGVGYSHIDIDAARGLGIAVTNTPDVLTDCTADLAITLMLMVARRAGEGERELRSGNWTGWRPTHMIGSKVSGKTLGLVGMGRIARAVAMRAQHGFGMKIVFFNRSRVPAEALAGLAARQCDTVEEVLAQSDFVSLHCPGGAATRHLINAERLALMRRDAFLINTARGEVVDEAALVDALRSGTIAGAGLDVFEREPLVSEGLMTLENVVLLPHLGSATRETRVGMGMRVLENVEAFFAGRTPPDRVA